ncbi:LysR family transcriptional regulator [Pseudonocardia humida]|uniref:LysR family transcriptional regulator n=1 Tax=Pseudonocardia humida TaxID=2800819 RepID=A0ABT1A9T5_9PSEU|nr:LysR family transcriptional regulator [Pseudonocardia humida]MCO1659773.1 LysR family transcriptional regulator [Pseudonocardia humida]
MLNVPRLRVLYEVAKAGSLTGAAKELNYTPSAVSQQLALLQKETNARLVERHRRGVRLTESGRQLVRHAAAVLAELRTAEAALDAVARGEGGRMRLGSFPTANATLMPRAVAAFQADRPVVELDLVELDSDEGLAQVAEHQLDIALVYEFPMTPMALAPDLEVLPLVVDPLHIMLPSDHPMAGKGSIGLAELSGERWIQGVRHGSTIQVLPQACRAAGFEPGIVFRTDDQMAVRGLVAAGLGVALVPWLALSTVPPGVVVRPLDEPNLTRAVSAALPSPARRLPAAVAMVESLRAVCAQLGTPPGRGSGRGR